MSFLSTPAPVPNAPAVPAPMQPTAGPDWHNDVHVNFEAAHNFFQPMVQELHAGAVVPQGVGYATVPSAQSQARESQPGKYAATGGGAGPQQYYDDGAGYDVGQSRAYIKEGSPFSQYNGGVDQGPQDQGFNGRGIEGYGNGSQYPLPMSEYRNGFILPPGATDPAITPFTNEWAPGTRPGEGYTVPPAEITPLSATAGRWTGPPVDYSDLGIPSDAGNYGGGE